MKDYYCEKCGAEPLFPDDESRHVLIGDDPDSFKMRCQNCGTLEKFSVSAEPRWMKQPRFSGETAMPERALLSPVPEGQEFKVGDRVEWDADLSINVKVPGKGTVTESNRWFSFVRDDAPLLGDTSDYRPSWGVRTVGLRRIA